VTLVGAQMMKISSSWKENECYLCTGTIHGVNDVLHAAKTHFKIEEEGPEEDSFVSISEAEKEACHQAKTSEQFKEPKKKWKNSQAKRILCNFMIDGTI
jgi:hypothetical protein